MMMIMRLSSCLGAVMMPRVSNLLAENQMDEFKVLIQKSYDFTLAIALPLTVGMFWGAPCIVRICAEMSLSHLYFLRRLSLLSYWWWASPMWWGYRYFILKENKLSYSVLSNRCYHWSYTKYLLDTFFSYEGTAIAYLGAEVVTTVSMYFIGKNTCLYPFQETPSELFGWMCCNVHCVNSYFSICLFSDTLILMLQVL